MAKKPAIMPSVKDARLAILDHFEMVDTETAKKDVDIEDIKIANFVLQNTLVMWPVARNVQDVTSLCNATLKAVSMRRRILGFEGNGNDNKDKDYEVGNPIS